MLSLFIKLLFSTLYEVSLGCLFQIIQIRQSNKILIKILLTVSGVVFLNAKIYVFALYKIAVNFLMFNLESHQRNYSVWDSYNGSFLP